MTDFFAKTSVKQKDLNGDDKLDFIEYHNVLVEPEAEEEQEKDHKPDEQVFKAIDVNEDGFVDSSELEHWYAGISDSENFVKQLFLIADHNKDSHISADELANSTQAIASNENMAEFFLWHEQAEQASN